MAKETASPEQENTGGETLAAHEFSIEPAPAPEPSAEPEEVVPTISGSIPVAADGASGSLRFTAVVDAEFVNGQLVSLGFNAAQYTAFADGKGRLSIVSSFPKR